MIIWWLRRDLRLADNPALKAALAEGHGLVPAFVLDPHTLKMGADKRTAFLHAGLRRLDADLRARGSRLVVREGDPAAVLQTLMAETQAKAIVAEEGYSPFARRRDADIASRFPLRLTAGRTVHHPSDVVKQDGAPYSVFSPFQRAWQALPLPTTDSIIAAPRRLPAVPEHLASVELPDVAATAQLVAGEAEAQRRLEAFVAGLNPPVHAYAERRHRLDRAGTSALSPYLRFGMLSARQAAVSALRAGGAGAEAWLRQLIWREFYQSVLYHFPNVLHEAMRPELRGMEWENDCASFSAWCAGQTGYPIVDAAMRQLVQSGWLHNRARMIAGSFLVKDLLINWQWGERFFMQHLIDGEVAANNGGWQWVAGAGTDAAPYVRIFNPVLQAQRFDPQGEYVRRWLPEIAAVPARFIHTPWAMPRAVQQECGCVIGRDYPQPIVDHAQARQRALSAYRRTS